MALIRQESLFDHLAFAADDGRGLTQVMPATGADIAKSLGRTSFSVGELFDAGTAVTFGARYLSAQIDRADGDIFRAVAAYNAGAGAASQSAARKRSARSSWRPAQRGGSRCCWPSARPRSSGFGCCRVRPGCRSVRRLGTPRKSGSPTSSAAPWKGRPRRCSSR